MCYPKPGPRCSKHADQARRKAKQSIDRAKKDLDAIKEMWNDERSEPRPDEDKIDQLRNEYNATHYTYIDAMKKFDRAESVYRSSPAGLRELKAKIGVLQKRAEQCGDDITELNEIELKKTQCERLYEKHSALRRKQIAFMKLAQQNCLTKHGYKLSPRTDPETFKQVMDEVGEENVYVGKTTIVEDTPENVRKHAILQARADKLVSYFNREGYPYISDYIIEDYDSLGLTPGFKLLGKGCYRAAYLDSKTGMVIKIPIDNQYTSRITLQLDYEQRSYAAIDLEALDESDVEYVETSFYRANNNPNLPIVVQKYLSPDEYEKISYEEAVEVGKNLPYNAGPLSDFHDGNMLRNKKTGRIVMFDCLDNC